MAGTHKQWRGKLANPGAPSGLIRDAARSKGAILPKEEALR